ncbi:hypothetical protein OJ996_19775 [Luteolibacter sp. GHJ8]|uniref:Uncharacterized protein n=1 Tax=Luteolibacter rhizosphaerae TaxID=2989719 RepID=A0ABT3G7K7_9BACT|nr:hypothetical protein [Luteolibacter rhizosphaerae]MCW1915836.1 hypothetical protein [Luteolibacter rhizosphaerae]
MSDTQGNTSQDRQRVALQQDHERRYVVDKFIEDHPGLVRSAVEEALDEAYENLKTNDREKLTAEISRIIGNQVR